VAFPPSPPSLARLVRPVLVAVVFCLGLHAPLDAETLDLSQLPPQWQALLQTLRAQDNDCAQFSEERYRPFRRMPSSFSGEAQFDPEEGLTLHYTDPVTVTYELHEHGLTRINPDGDRREFEQPEVKALARVMQHALAFDWAALGAQYTAEGMLEEDDWQLTLSPREGSDSEQLGYRTVVLSGDAQQLTHLELQRSARERVEISFSPCRE